MRLHNYWWLLIWLFLFGAVSVAFIPKREELVLGKKEVRWNWLPALIMAVPYVIWAAWRANSFGDTGAYRRSFMDAPTSLTEVGSYLLSRSKDRGYALIEAVFKSVLSHSDIVFFFFIAAIQIGCLLFIYRKYSKNYWLSFFLFVASTDYMSWMHNGIRQFLAAAIIFACIPLFCHGTRHTFCQPDTLKCVGFSSVCFYCKRTCMECPHGPVYYWCYRVGFLPGFYQRFYYGCDGRHRLQRKRRDSCK